MLQHNMLCYVINNVDASYYTCTYSEAVGVAALWELPRQKNAGLSGQID